MCYIHNSSFHTSHSPFRLTVWHVSHLDKRQTARRYLTFRVAVRHLSQLERCLTANASVIFRDEIGQKRPFRSLVLSKSRHNFLTKKRDTSKANPFSREAHPRRKRQALAGGWCPKPPTVWRKRTLLTPPKNALGTPLVFARRIVCGLRQEDKSFLNKKNIVFYTSLLNFYYYLCPCETGRLPTPERQPIER